MVGNPAIWLLPKRPWTETIKATYTVTTMKRLPTKIYKENSSSNCTLRDSACFLFFRFFRCRLSLVFLCTVHSAQNEHYLWSLPRQFICLIFYSSIPMTTSWSNEESMKLQACEGADPQSHEQHLNKMVLPSGYSFRCLQESATATYSCTVEEMCRNSLKSQVTKEWQHAFRVNYLEAFHMCLDQRAHADSEWKIHLVVLDILWKRLNLRNSFLDLLRHFVFEILVILPALGLQLPWIIWCSLA